MKQLAAFLAVTAGLAAQPNVLIVGDSISGGYTPTVTRLLEGKAVVERAAGAGGPTTSGVANLPAVLARKKWDVIHFNWGLHDIKITATGARQVPLEQYENNLRQLVAEMRKTGARLIWATTTPVPEGKQGPMRHKGDEVLYNQAALRIMTAAGVEINDLYAFALPRLAAIQQPSNVHYTGEGYEALGQQVAAAILRQLPGARP